MLVVLLLLLIGLAVAPTALPLLGTSEASAAEQFFFDRQEIGILALTLAAFATWIRRAQLARTLEENPTLAGRSLSWVLGVLGCVLLVWANRIAAADLHIFSLVLLFLALATHPGGLSALRVLRLPIAISLFVLPLPAPLYNELVWAAQRLATDFSAIALMGMGYPISTGSMLISILDHDFWVIETCSGLRSMELLTLMTVLLVETAPRRSPWDFGLVLFAPLLAFLLNVIRIVAIVVYDHKQANASDHVLQGLVAVFVGTIVMFVLQRVLVSSFGALRQGLDHAAPAASSRAPSVASVPPPAPSIRARRFAAAALVVALAAVGTWVPSWPTELVPLLSVDSFPTEESGWTSTPSDPMRMFFNTLPIGATFRRTYKHRVPGGRRVDVVNLTLAAKSPGAKRLSLRASKFAWLGPDWEAVARGKSEVWQLGETGHWYEAIRGDERFLVLIVWLDASSLLREIVDCALGLGQRPGVVENSQLVIRLAAPIDPGQREARAIERARKAIYRFLEVFDDDLLAFRPGS